MGILGKKKNYKVKLYSSNPYTVFGKNKGDGRERKWGEERGGERTEKRKKKFSLSCLIYKYSLLVGPTIKISLRDKWREIQFISGSHHQNYFLSPFLPTKKKKKKKMLAHGGK